VDEVDLRRGREMGFLCPTTIPTGATGCGPNDYAPEICCELLKLCCQNDNGAFVDYGGACTAAMCK